MADTTVESFDGLHDWVESYADRVIIFRGVKDASYKLIPKVGRYKKFMASNVEKEEKMMLRLFREQALPYLDFRPGSDWEWLAIAQHHGLPTRLLDWTRNPLVAAYFAGEQAHDGDSAIYAYHTAAFVATDKHKDPFALKEVGKFIPTHVTRRITAQVGPFTIHPNPKEPFESPDIDRLIIKFSRTTEEDAVPIRNPRASLFPDLDGLTAHIEWLRTDVY